jgi:hypothetical protein
MKNNVLNKKQDNIASNFVKRKNVNKTSKEEIYKGIHLDIYGY